MALSVTHVLASIPSLSCTSVFCLTLWPINELRFRPSRSSSGVPWRLAMASDWGLGGELGVLTS